MSTDSTRMGGNRTGMQRAPLQAKRMIETVRALRPELEQAQALAETRLEYAQEADVIGTVPPPVMPKGTGKAAAEKLTGARPQAFIDKLAERLAFERGGVRLYDAVLVKFQAHADELDGVSLDDVQHIRDEEAEHALMIEQCIEELGADPTAQTPSADLVGVETMGLLQAATDPRTTLAETLHAALGAELLDHAGWETLITMAQNMGKDELAKRFRTALQHEDEHLQNVRSWYNSLTLGASRLM